jgi:type IV pilus assembly protein PilW
MHAFRIPRFHDQRGFSLIEGMGGAAIALIGMVVIFQVLTVWEERKRTTSAGSDAQVAGALAMYALESDLRLAGFGFGMTTYMGCTITAFDTVRGAAITGTATQPVFRLYPVEILKGAGGSPDEIRVLYGNSGNFTANLSFTQSPTAFSKRTLGAGTGFQPGELAIVAGNSPANCDLVEITGTANSGQDLVHATGAYTNYLGQVVTARFNAAAGTGVVYSSGTLHNLGPAQQWQPAPPAVLVPQWNIWHIQPAAGGTVPRVLAWSDYLHVPQSGAVWTEVAEGIINLQAQYGYDNDANNRIECPNGAGLCEWTSTLQAPPLSAPIVWSRVRAVRVALLARSQQYEKLAVTTTAPSWAGGTFAMTNVDGTADNNPGDPNDWRHYRYRVYQQVVPLRNMIWGTAP